MSVNEPVKISTIQAKTKILGHEVHLQSDIYWLPKIEVNNMIDQKFKFYLSRPSLYFPETEIMVTRQIKAKISSLLKSRKNPLF